MSQRLPARSVVPAVVDVVVVPVDRIPKRLRVPDAAGTVVRFGVRGRVDVGGIVDVATIDHDVPAIGVADVNDVAGVATGVDILIENALGGQVGSDRRRGSRIDRDHGIACVGRSGLDFRPDEAERSQSQDERDSDGGD